MMSDSPEFSFGSLDITSVLVGLKEENTSLKKDIIKALLFDHPVEHIGLARRKVIP
ncbi:hypothetical protein [Mannheimia haemolytica]|uniref:hypothetical protein n=1 Tax=Mannheimia haemolytica TaxID=75985 RepID=UPI00311E589A